MEIIANIIVGFLIGMVARFFKSGRDNMGFILTTTLGVLGSVLANILGQSIGWYGPGETAGFFASVFGAVVLLMIVGFIKKK